MTNLTPEKIADLRTKQLEMIQSIIARLASYSATLKNYCITVTTATCGFALTSHKPTLVAVGFLPIIVFSLLDAQYLRNERRFRGLFNEVIKESWSEIPQFNFDINQAPRSQYMDALWSWSIFSFYAPLGLGVAVVTLSFK